MHYLWQDPGPKSEEELAWSADLEAMRALYWEYLAWRVRHGYEPTGDQCELFTRCASLVAAVCPAHLAVDYPDEG